MNAEHELVAPSLHEPGIEAFGHAVVCNRTAICDEEIARTEQKQMYSFIEIPEQNKVMSLIDWKIYMIQTRRKSRGKAERNPRGRAGQGRYGAMSADRRLRGALPVRGGGEG